MRGLGIAAAVAALVGTIGAAAQGPSGVAGPSLPEALRRSAIETRSDRTGLIAGARIGATDLYVVYLRTERGCGSGGCRAQIWKREGDRFVRGESLPAGHLPIMILPRIVNGTPVLGITVFDKGGGRPSVLPVAFDGKDFTQQLSVGLAAETVGDPLITSGLLQRF